MGENAKRVDAAPGISISRLRAVLPPGLTLVMLIRSPGDRYVHQTAPLHAPAAKLCLFVPQSHVSRQRRARTLSTSTLA